MSVCIFFFLIVAGLSWAGGEDYHSRGGTDTPYPWEEAVNQYAWFMLLLSLVMIAAKLALVLCRP